MNDNQLIITRHAYERYCERVEKVTRDALHAQVVEQIKQPQRRKKDYIQLDGVWWRYGVSISAIILHTCYGIHHIDLPAAIKWAKRNNDRIGLGVGDLI